MLARGFDAVRINVRDHKYFYGRGDGVRVFHRPSSVDRARILAGATNHRLAHARLSRARRPDIS